MTHFRSLAWTVGVLPIMATAFAQSPRTVWTRKGHASAVNAVEFSRDGETLASASDGTVALAMNPLHTGRADDRGPRATR